MIQDDASSRDPSLVPSAVVDRIVRALQAGNIDGLAEGFRRAQQRLSQFPKHDPRKPVPSGRELRAERLLHLLGIAIGRDDDALRQGRNLYPWGRDEPEVKTAIDRVVAARRSALGLGESKGGVAVREGMADADLRRLADALPPTVRLGTSTWTYPGWRGLVYHRDYGKKGQAAALLEEYARFPLFRTVGIDSTFYAPPTPEMLTSYAGRLPLGFSCVAKVWDRLTIHTFSKAKDKERANQPNPDFLNPDLFLEAVDAPTQRHFRDHAGPYVFEFQAFHPRTITPDQLAHRLDQFFRALPSDRQYAVEIRNPDFLVPSYFDVLRRHGVAHVLNSWTRMPSIGEQLDLPDVLTAPFAVARALLRPGRSYDEAVDAFAPYDRIRELYPEGRADLLRLLGLATAGGGRTTYVLVNNRLEGSAPQTIIGLAEAWASRPRGWVAAGRRR